MNKAGNAFGKIVIWLLVIVLIVGVAFVALFFVMRNQGATYYVEYGNERYLGGTNGESIFLAADKQHEFSVKSLAGGKVDFSAKVMASGETTVRFSFDNELHALYNGNAELDDYSEVFGLKKGADGFSLTLPDNFTVEQAIEAKYGEEAVLLDELSDLLSYFELLVTVGKSEVVLRFAFEGQAKNPSSGIEIDPPQIIF